MRNALAIAEREIKTFFVSPIAYVVMAVFVLLAGFFFTSLIDQFQQILNMVMMQRRMDLMEQINVNAIVIAPTLSNLTVVLMFIIPLVTMRSFAEEKHQKTDELLLTSPITITEIVAGKFLGALAFVLVMISLIGIYPWILVHYGNPPPEIGPMLTGYLGLVLIATSYVAVGIFTSSLTENQIVAAVISFFVCLLIFIIGWSAQAIPTKWLADALKYVSIQDHFENMAKGLLDTRDLVYYFSFAALWLFLAKRSVESVRWR